MKGSTLTLICLTSSFFGCGGAHNQSADEDHKKAVEINKKHIEKSSEVLNKFRLPKGNSGPTPSEQAKKRAQEAKQQKQQEETKPK